MGKLDKHRPRGWTSGNLRIAGHALERAAERLRERFGSIPVRRAAQMLEGALRNPRADAVPLQRRNGEVKRMAVPFVWPRSGEITGYLILKPDERQDAHYIAVTWLDPRMIDGVRSDVEASWWPAYCESCHTTKEASDG